MKTQNEKNISIKRKFHKENLFLFLSVFGTEVNEIICIDDVPYKGYFEFLIDWNDLNFSVIFCCETNKNKNKIFLVFVFISICSALYVDGKEIVAKMSQTKIALNVYLLYP